MHVTVTDAAGVWEHSDRQALAAAKPEHVRDGRQQHIINALKAALAHAQAELSLHYALKDRR
jgi:hypothetical protein